MQKEEKEYVKLTQKDFTLAFKHQVPSEIEQLEPSYEVQQKSMEFN